jgi:hypothetical protein
MISRFRRRPSGAKGGCEGAYVVSERRQHTSQMALRSVTHGTVPPGHDCADDHLARCADCAAVAMFVRSIASCRGVRERVSLGSAREPVAALLPGLGLAARAA